MKSIESFVRVERAVISDIVSDEPVPEALRQDAHLWSGCISGALSQTEFLEGFRDGWFLWHDAAQER